MLEDAPARDDPDFRKIRAVLERAVQHACPPQLAGQAEDIVQHAIVRLVARVRQAEGALDFGSSYLWKVAQHAVIDELRRRRVRPEPASPRTDTVVGSDDPEVALTGQRITAGIDDCMQGIAADRRAAVGLYLQGMSVPEISRALRWDRKRTENLVYRGLTDLRKCLLSKGLRP